MSFRHAQGSVVISAKRACCSVLMFCFFAVTMLAQTQSAPPSTGMRLWLKADAGIVQDENSNITQWQDQSGNNNHAVGTAGVQVLPNALNGQPVIDFSSSSSLSLPGVVSDETTAEMFIVVKLDSVTSGTGYSFGSILGQIYYPYSNGEVLDYSGGINTDAGKPTQNLAVYVIYNVSIGPNGKTIRLNGVAQYHRDGPIDSTTISFPTDGYLGGFDGEIAEAVVYNRELDDSEHGQVLSYLQQKYAVIQAPVAPVNLTARNGYLGGLMLQWQPGAAQQSLYEVQRLGPGDADFVTIGSNLSQPSFNDSSAVTGQTYQYRVRTLNSLGQKSAYSEVLTVIYNVVSGNAIPGNGLRLWLRADKGVLLNEYSEITQWQDQSWNGNHATGDLGNSSWQSPSVLANAQNGQSVMDFYSGATLILPGVVEGEAAAEMFIVVKLDSVTSGNSYSFGDILGQVDYPNYRGKIIDYAGGITTDTGKPPLDLTTYAIYSVAVGPNGKTVRFNGVTQYHKAGPIDSQSIYFPSSGVLGSYGFAGGIAEVVVYNRELGDSEHSQILSYLQQKYAVISTPVTPVGLVANNGVAGRIVLQWQPGVTQPSLYEVQRLALGDADFVTVATGLYIPNYLDTGVVVGQTYQYRVRALNSLGQTSDYTAPVSVSCPSGQGQVINGTGLRLWLRADKGLKIVNEEGADRTSQWLDQSGNFNNAMGLRGNSWSYPDYYPRVKLNAMNAQPAITFYGYTDDAQTADGGMSVPSVLAGEHQAEIFLVLKKKPASYLETALTFCGNISISPSEVEDDVGGLSTPIQKTIQDLSTYFIYNVSIGAEKKTIRLNGVVHYEMNVNPESVRFDDPSFDSFEAGTLGLTPWTESYGQFDGEIAEIVVYNRELSAVERNDTVTYLQQRYAVIPAPVAPTQVDVETTLTGVVVLRWQPGSATLCTFNVQRRREGDADFTTLATGLSQTNYVDHSVVAGETYYYRLTVTNGLAQTSAYSDTVTITYQSPVVPVPVTDIGLWLRADSGVKTESVSSLAKVKAWRDQSGNVLDATAVDFTDTDTRPELRTNQINALSAVHFGLNQVGLNIPNIMGDATAGELFVILKKDSTSTTNTGAYAHLYNGHSCNYGYQGAITDNFLSTTYDTVVPQCPLNSAHCYSIAASAGLKEIWLNGVLRLQTASNELPDLVTYAYMGGSIGPGDQGAWGSIAEVLFYRRVLSEVERSQVMNYLQSRYALVSTPSQPMGLQVEQTLLGDRAILSWQQVTGQEVYYEIQRKADDETDYVTIATNLTGTYYNDTSVVAGKRYTYRIVAKNAFGQTSDASAGVVINIAPVSLPISTTGMRLWLRADKGLSVSTSAGIDYVTRWADQGPVANDAIAKTSSSGYTLARRAATDANGMPAINFARTYDALSFADTLPTASTGEYFVVLKKATGSGNYTMLGLCGGHNLIFPSLSSDSICDNFMNYQGYSFTPGADPTGWLVYNASSSADAWTARINGTLRFTRAGALWSPRSDSYNIGLHGFYGEVAEIIVYDRALTDAERDAVVQYLHSEYALIAAPIAPTSLVAFTSVLAPQVELRWQAGAVQSVSYEVQRKGPSDADFVTLSTGALATIYIDSTVQGGASYSYRVRAVNGLDATSAYCDVAEVTVPVATTAIPALGVRLWLQSDRGVVTNTSGYVTEWLDQSGSRHHAVAQRKDSSNNAQVVASAINGQPAMHFNGYEGYSISSGMQNVSAGEVFVYHRKSASLSTSDTSLANSYGRSLWGATTRYPYNDNKIHDSMCRSGEAVFTPTQSIFDFHLYDVASNSSDGSWVARINGVEQYRDRPYIYFSSDLTLGGYYYGYYYSNVGYCFGDIAEVLIYDRVLSDAERQQVESYFYSKYSQTMMAPVFSPQAGRYEGQVTVTASTATENADIYYTLDGSDPVPLTSTRYNGPIVVSGGSAVLKALAYKDGAASSISSGTYSIGVSPGAQVATSGWDATYYQNADFSGGSTKQIVSAINFNSYYSGLLSGTMSAVWVGSVTAQYSENYTFYVASTGNPKVWIDGNLLIDGTSQTSYEERSGTMRLNAGQSYLVRIEYLTRYPTYTTNERIVFSWSSLSIAEEVVPVQQVLSGLPYGSTVSTPVVAPAAGHYAGTISLSLSASASTGRPHIYYTLNGSEPSPSSTLYTGPISIHQDIVLRARAYAANNNNSGLLVAAYVFDNTGPVLSNIKFNGSDVPAVIGTNGTFSVDATDSSGVKQVEFRLDGQLIATDTYAGDGFNASIAISKLSDGVHTLTVQAWDTLNTPSDVLTSSFSILMPPPAAPVITEPLSGKKTNVQNLTIRGNAEKNSTVRLYRGSDLLASTQAGVDGSFSTSVTLVAGSNSITATAQNRNPQPSAASDAITVIYDTTVPNAPTMLTARTRSSGQILLSWNSSGLSSGFYVFRSTAAISDGAVLSPAASVSGRIIDKSYTDTPPTDGHYYYRVINSYAVDDGVTLSSASNQADALSDRTGPSATVRLVPLGTLYDSVNHRYGVGMVQVTVTTSEALLTAPFFNLITSGGPSIFVELSKSSESEYTGVFSIQSTTQSGPLSATFSGYDSAGNRGSTVTMSEPAIIDTEGPSITELVPVRITGTQTTEDLVAFKSVKNEAVFPATAVTLTWRFTLSEAPKNGAVPMITASLSEHPALTIPVSVTDANDSDTRTWVAQLTLPSQAGEITENLLLGLSVNDDLGNLGETINPAHSFQIYRGTLPPLAVPNGLVATAQPAGKIKLTWNSIPEAAAYVLQVKGPGQSAFGDLVTLPAMPLEYSYTPAVDGLYTYRLASVRMENNQDSTSGWSDESSARSDRVAPPAPTGTLTTEVYAQGVKITWTAPADISDVDHYVLYRSGTAITDITGLTPILSNVLKLSGYAVDTRPDGTAPYYAFISVDQAGNCSAPITGFANVSLLPVQTISVAQTDSSAPVLTWANAPGCVIDGYKLAIDGSEISVSGVALLAPSVVTYTDSNYTGVDRVYTVKTISGPQSKERSLTLPQVAITLADDAEIKRGLIDQLSVHIKNNSAQPIEDAHLLVHLDGRDHSPQNFVTVAAGAETVVPVVVGGYDDLPTGTVPVTITLTDLPNDGETVTMTHSASAKVGEGAFTAEVLPGDFTRGGMGKVRFKLTNPTALPIEFVVAKQNGGAVSDEARLKVTDLQGALLSETPLQLTSGDNVVTLANGTTVVRIPAGSTYTSPVISVPVPVGAQAQVMAALEIDYVYYSLGDAGSEVKLKGLRAQAQVATIETSYYAVVNTISPAISNGDQPIVISGRALWRNIDSALPTAGAGNLPVVVYVEVSGFIRQETVITSSTGAFTYTFVPGEKEAGGVYQVWVNHPDLTSIPDTTATFTIRRVIISPVNFSYRAPRNYRQALPVTLATGPGTSVQNVRAVLVGDLPVAVDVKADPLALVGPNQTVTLPLSIVGLAATQDSINSGSMVFKIVSDDGVGGEYEWSRIVVNYEFSDAHPYLQGTPNLVEIGVQPAQIASETIVLKNTGFAPWEETQLSLVSEDINITPLPAWIRLQTSASPGTLDVGGELNVIIAAAPPSDAIAIDQVYHLYLHVTGRDATAQDFPVSVTVSPSGKGDALLMVIDPYYQLTLADGAENPAFNGLSQASVTLEKDTSTGIPSVTQSATTDTNGEVHFTDLLAGSYKVRINATKHDSYIGRIVIKAGIVYTEQIVLPYSPVTFTWSVVPITFTDRYDIVLTATYETNVPMPVLVADPASLKLPLLCAGQVYTGEFHVTNQGLVSAPALKITMPADDEYYSYEMLASVGDKILPHQTITVPYRIKCLKPLPGVCTSVASSSSSSSSASSAYAINSALSTNRSYGALEQGGTTQGNGGCSYGTSIAVEAHPPCAEGQVYTVSVSIPMIAVYNNNCGGPGGVGTGWSSSSGSGSGSSGGPSWDVGSSGSSGGGSSPCPPHIPRNGGGGPGPGGGPGGGSSSSSSSSGGGSSSSSCGSSSSGPDPDPNRTCPPPKDDQPSRDNCAGSWVDLASRQYLDAATDLSVRVPGGTVDMWRQYQYRRWWFRLDDEMFALGTSSGSKTNTIVLNSQPYVALSGSSSFTMGNDVRPLSEVPVGTYSLAGVGPDTLTKRADGTFLWEDRSEDSRLYSATGQLMAIYRRAQMISQYHYNADGHVSDVADRDGNTVLTVQYDQNRVSGARDNTGRQVGYEYDTEGRLAKATDPMGNTTVYSYDNFWHITQKQHHIAGTDASADHITTASYSLFYSVSSPEAPPTRVVTGHPLLGEETRAQITSVSHNTGESKSYIFKHSDGEQTLYAQVTSSTGWQEEYLFNMNGDIISRSVAGETAYKIEQSGRTRVITRGSQRTTEDLDERDNVIRRVNPDNTIELYEYDPVLNKVTKYTDQAGVITQYTYDSDGNRLTTTEAYGTSLQRQTQYQYYTGTHLVKLQTNPDGQQTAYTYDTSDRLLSRYDPANPTRQTKYTYNSDGRVESILDALGGTTSYTYDSTGRELSETNPLGESTVYTYDGENIVQIETGKTLTAAGRIARYTYDSRNRRISEKRVDSLNQEYVVKTFEYDRDGRLIAEKNALGQATTYRYDVYGNRSVVSVPDADGGRSENFTAYDVLGHVSAQLDAVGAKTTITYGSNNLPSAITHAVDTPLTWTTSYKYDAKGRQIEEQIVDPNDSTRVYTTTSTYDALGQRVSAGGTRVYATTFVYDSGGRVVRETDALGRVTTYEYDTHGQSLRTKINGALIASYEYDAAGQRITQTDGEGNHRHTHYDILGRATHQSIPLPSSQAIPANWWEQPAFVQQASVYNRFGQVESTTSYVMSASGTPQAVTSTVTYDDFGRVASETGPTGLTRAYTYDDADNVLKIAYPPVASSGSLAGSSEIYVRSPYNAALVDASVDRAGNTTNFAYDEALRVTDESNSLSGVTHRVYDLLGRVTAATDPAGNKTQYEYDLFGNAVRITYPDHVATTHERIETMAYDTHGKITQKAGAGEYPLVYRYDAVGNMQEMQDGNGHITRWTYTDLNQPATKTYADGKFYTYTYDLAGHLKTRRDAMSRTTTYTYNAFGLVTSIDYPSDPDVAFVYDAYGLRQSMTDGSGTTTWTYDALGRSSSETQSRSHRSLEYSYDDNNQRTTVTVKRTDVTNDAGWQTSYGYDNAGRLHTVLDDRLPGAAPFTYTYATNANLVTQIKSPTGLTTAKTYDNSGRLTSTVSKRADGGTINSFSYTYDAAGQRDTETSSDAARTFGYDAYRQLTQAVTTAGTTETDRYTYSFDAIGNRLEAGRSLASAPSETTTYTPNSVNQYASILTPGSSTPDSPTYDDNGNTTTQQGQTLRYDEENRLVEVVNGLDRCLYNYDASGRRVEKLTYTNGTPSGLVRYVYDGWRVIEELDENYATQRSYTLGLDLSGSMEGAGGIGGLLAISKPSGSTYTAANYFYDGNGNVTDLAADDGSSVAHYTYTPFGDRLTATGTWAEFNAYQFSSKPREAINGFYYYGLRYYNPSTGRWPNRDPMEEDGGLNLYGFCGNDSINRFDAFGESFLGQDGLGWSLFGRWLTPGSDNKQSSKRLQWSDFDPSGNAKKQLSEQWVKQNAAALKSLCASSQEGDTFYTNFQDSTAYGNFSNGQTQWIGLWKGEASMYKQAGVLVKKKNCCCDFEVGLDFYAHDMSDFNPGQGFGPDWGSKRNDSRGSGRNRKNGQGMFHDDDFIWLRDHTPLGRDYLIYANSYSPVNIKGGCK